LDPTGGGAAWARIAIAARIPHPSDAIECARRAFASNPEAWRPWYEAFLEHAACPFEEPLRSYASVGGQEGE
jgi:hypothetical protein